MIYQFTQNGLSPDCHAERNGATPVILNGTEWSEGSVTDSSLTLRMTYVESLTTKYNKMQKINLCFKNYEPPQSNVLGVFSEGVLCTSGESDGGFGASAEDVTIRDLDW